MTVTKILKDTFLRPTPYMSWNCMQQRHFGSQRGELSATRFTQNKKRTILLLEKEPMLHILNNPLESQNGSFSSISVLYSGPLVLHCNKRANFKVSSPTLLYYPFLVLCVKVYFTEMHLFWKIHISFSLHRNQTQHAKFQQKLYIRLYRMLYIRFLGHFHKARIWSSSHANSNFD